MFFRALEDRQVPGLVVVEVDLNRLAADFLFGKVDRGVSGFQAAALFVLRFVRVFICRFGILSLRGRLLLGVVCLLGVVGVSTAGQSQSAGSSGCGKEG